MSAGRTAEFFERYLPYALTLGVEQQWNEQFHVVAAAATVDGNADAPRWYQSAHWDIHQTSHFTRAFGGRLTQTIAASSTAPGPSFGLGRRRLIWWWWGRGLVISLQFSPARQESFLNTCNESV